MSKSKAEIRADIQKYFSQYSSDQLKELSQQVQQRLLKNQELKKVKSIGLYAALKKEVYTEALFNLFTQQKVQVFFPRVKTKTELQWVKVQFIQDLQKGALGILEPKTGLSVEAINQIEALIIPGLAFDLQGQRLGKGFGYYDRALKNYSGLRIALAYDFQVFPEIPFEAHDEKMDIIITPSQEICCH